MDGRPQNLRRSCLLDTNGLPKNRINPKFTHFVNDHNKVMTENFTKRFVDHRNIGLAAKRMAKLAFHHAERGFNVRPLVVVLQEFLLAEVEIVLHGQRDRANDRLYRSKEAV
jgi:hypothetical protein